MSKGNTFENDLLKLIFQATAIANIADNAATSPLTNLYVSLHTADPGEGGSQTTSEATYTGYARVAVARTSGGWTVTTNNVTNAAAITFGACTAGSETLTHFAVGTAASGAGKILYKGALATSLLGAFIGETDDNITIPGLSGVAVDDRIAFYPVENSSLPTGITEGTVYWVKTVASDVITISTTQGGGTLDITAIGDGIAVEVGTLAVSSGITPEFAAGALDLYED